MATNLEDYVSNYDYRNGVMLSATNYCTGIFLKWMGGKSVLELGPAEGVMTDLIYPHYKDYTVVEGSVGFCNNLRKRYPNMIIENSYFEEYCPDRKFDNIILGHVLEHVDSPKDILSSCSSWLNSNGIILCAVPNSHSIHRQAAVLMGMLESENSLNDSDKKVGHKRVYNFEGLKQIFLNAGLNIKESGGYWLKPLANSQIESSWTNDMIQSFMKLGEKYPEIAGEIYVIASK